MNRILRFILLAGALAGLVGCLRDRFIRIRPDQPLVPPVDPTSVEPDVDRESSKPAVQKSVNRTAILDPLAAANNAFAADLFQQTKAQVGNIVLSPSSIHSALCMTCLGARNETARQMAQALHVSMPDDKTHQMNRRQMHEWNRDSSSSSQLSVANHLWGQQGIAWKPEFLRANQQYYDASLSNVDFENQPADACRAINDWVNTQTRGKIPSIVSSNDVGAGTRMVLTNAVYFRSDWATKFDPNATGPEPF